MTENNQDQADEISAKAIWDDGEYTGYVPCARCGFRIRCKDADWIDAHTHLVVCFNCTAQIVAEWVNSTNHMRSLLS